MSGVTMQPLQKAIVAALEGNAPLMAAMTGIYDLVPEETAFPYLHVEQGDSEVVQTLTTYAERLQLQLVIYSRYGGRKEVLDIAAQVHDLLHDQELALDTGFDLVWLRVEAARVEQLIDGLTWRGRMNVSALIEKTV